MATVNPRSAARDDKEWAKEMPLRNAVVVYESRYGKTRKLAESLASGLESQGIRTELLTVHEAAERPLGGYDLVAIGSPAHYLVPSAEMRAFMAGLARTSALREHYGYAFETRIKSHPGGAARWIESELTRAGLRIPRPHDAAVVEPHKVTPPKATEPDGAEFRLHAGSEDYFRAVGIYLVQRIRGELPENFA